jgi:uncharacterized protein
MNSMKKIRLPLTIERLVNRYINAFAPEQIIVFGSFAKGTNHTGSDVDLLIVTETAEGSVYLRKAHQLALNCFPKVDVIFVTLEDIGKATEMKNPFLLSILGSGISIYERKRQEPLLRGRLK